MTAPLPKSALRLLAGLAQPGRAPRRPRPGETGDAAALVAADLAVADRDGSLAPTAAGRAHLARLALARNGIDGFAGQHLALAAREVETETGRASVTIDEAESPLAWLARRKGRDGRALIEPVQLQAGERLRADFTRAQLMPRTTSNWSMGAGRSGAASPMHYADAVIAARQRVRRAMTAVGAEFAGLLLDVCCFLKGLEDIERERGWPQRSGKVVLQLALDRLAQHYGYRSAARGAPHPALRTWLAPDAEFAADALDPVNAG